MNRPDVIDLRNGRQCEPPPPPPLTNLDRIKAKVAEDLRRAGKEPVSLPPTEPPQSDMGLSWKEMERLAEVKKKAAKLPKIEECNEFLNKQIIRPPVLIEGILHQGSKMSISGGSKSFKTWILLSLALSVASGYSWLGFSTTKSKVLYCNFEIQTPFMQDRIRAIELANGVKLESGSLDLWNLRGQAASADVILPAILERIKQEQYGLIILDPIYKLYGDLDENSAGDVAALMNELENLAEKANAAVVFGAHYSKGNQAGKESIDRVSGSGVFSRDPDSLIAFTQHEEKEAFVVEPVLRNFKQVEPFVVKWEYPLMKRAELLNPRKLKTAIGRKAVYTVSDLLKILAPEPMTTIKLRDAAVNEIRMSQARAYELMKELKTMEGVTFDEKERRWAYEPPHPNTLT